MNCILLISFLSIISTLATAKHEAREITTPKQFYEVMNSKKPTFILFYAPWCAACTSMKEPFNVLAERYYEKAQIVKINADSENLKEIVDSFGIEGIPTLVIKSLGAMKKETLLDLAKILIGPAQPVKKDNPSKKETKKSAIPPKKATPKPNPQKKSSKKSYSSQITRKK